MVTSQGRTQPQATPAVTQPGNNMLTNTSVSSMCDDVLSDLQKSIAQMQQVFLATQKSTTDYLQMLKSRIDTLSNPVVTQPTNHHSNATTTSTQSVSATGSTPQFHAYANVPTVPIVD